jgi:cation:H+ antiporter
MWLDLILLILSLFIILISCELFTNGIEWLGKRLKFGDGVVGSIFSAIGTCLPETIIPIVAILFSGSLKGTEASNSVDIGIGAIIGAPFMLSTLAFFVTGISVLVFRKRRRTGMKMNVNTKILGRDIGFFIIVYGIGIGTSFIQSEIIKYIVAVFLILYYLFYIYLTVKNDSESSNEIEALYIMRFFKTGSGLGVIILQILVALAGIVFGAELFVENIRGLSELFGISALILSLIIAPIATELPEKFNSVIWISRNKDTLALGNITGAMVFQSCIPISIGIVFTPWILDQKVIVSATLAILSASLTYFWIKKKNKLTPVPLISGGLFYLAFIVYLVLEGFK